jgi:hypothetical protein
MSTTSLHTDIGSNFIPHFQSVEAGYSVGE